MRLGEDEAKNTTAVWLSGADVDELESVPANVVFATVMLGLADKVTATSASEILISFCNSANFSDTSETLTEISSKLFVEIWIVKTTFGCGV